MPASDFCLADNDIIKKLAICNLLDEALVELARDALSQGPVNAVKIAYFGAATLAMAAVVLVLPPIGGFAELMKVRRLR